MNEIFFSLVISGLSYFSIYRVTSSTKKTVSESSETILSIESRFQAIEQIIKGLDQRFRALEVSITLQKSDSSRLIEWLDKRDRELLEIQSRFLKNLKLEDREKTLQSQQSKIIEISEQLRLIKTIKE